MPQLPSMRSLEIKTFMVMITRYGIIWIFILWEIQCRKCQECRSIASHKNEIYRFLKNLIGMKLHFFFILSDIYNSTTVSRSLLALASTLAQLSHLMVVIAVILRQRGMTEGARSNCSCKHCHTLHHSVCCAAGDILCNLI